MKTHNILFYLGMSIIVGYVSGCTATATVGDGTIRHEYRHEYVSEPTVVTPTIVTVPYTNQMTVSPGFTNTIRTVTY